MSNSFNDEQVKKQKYAAISILIIVIGMILLVISMVYGYKKYELYETKDFTTPNTTFYR
jgi:hypothetical protein